ncbi:MAG: sulfatase-like hydrolase/transferase [Candidatus Sumerlaeota bacterium]|nr:sulfatase-like hydrolase/transferase [Candidatus Sumerlaeota bacterium]
MYDPSDIDLDASVTDETSEGKPYVHEEQTRRWGTDGLPEKTWRKIVARYYGMETMVDDAVGRILDRLHELGLEDSTLVIFTTDHGDAVGNHRMYDKGYCAYEEQFHIPLILRGVGLRRAGMCDQWITSLDLMPTIVEAAQLELPPDLEIDGRSLLPAFREGVSLGRDSIFAEFHGMQYGLCSLRMARNERHKYVLNVNDRAELYDLMDDPCELRNLAGTAAAADDERSMHDKLLRWMERTRDPLLKTIWGRAAFDPHYIPSGESQWLRRSAIDGALKR